MFTSYFANLKNLKYPIAIVVGIPKWYKGFNYPILAPDWSLLNQYKELLKQDQKEAETYYIEKFNKKLEALDVHKIIADLCTFYKKVNLNEISLICYEKPGDFCHRHLVAEWLSNNGYSCYEIRPGLKQL